MIDLDEANFGCDIAPHLIEGNANMVKHADEDSFKTRRRNRVRNEIAQGVGRQLTVYMALGGIVGFIYIWSLFLQQIGVVK